MEVEYKKTNRQKRMTPRRPRCRWCPHCDMRYVNEGRKCKACGYIEGVKRLKKE